MTIFLVQNRICSLIEQTLLKLNYNVNKIRKKYMKNHNFFEKRKLILPIFIFQTFTENQAAAVCKNITSTKN